MNRNVLVYVSHDQRAFGALSFDLLFQPLLDFGTVGFQPGDVVLDGGDGLLGSQFPRSHFMGVDKLCHLFVWFGYLWKRGG